MWFVKVAKMTCFAAVVGNATTVDYTTNWIAVLLQYVKMAGYMAEAVARERAIRQETRNEYDCEVPVSDGIVRLAPPRIFSL